SAAYLGKARRTSWDFRKTDAQTGCAAYFLGKNIFGFRLPENGSRNEWKRYEDGGKSLENVVESGGIRWW
nr:hypothetical protein [Tanacetum cinerariifolium]